MSSDNGGMSAPSASHCYADDPVMRPFPIIPGDGVEPHPMTIPWAVAELAYSVYAAKYGREQSLDRLAQRGGFHASEMDEYMPHWRDMSGDFGRLKGLVSALWGQIEFMGSRRERGWDLKFLSDEVEWAKSV